MELLDSPPPLLICAICLQPILPDENLLSSHGEDGWRSVHIDCAGH
jgi:hypothetical protein